MCLFNTNYKISHNGKRICIERRNVITFLTHRGACDHHYIESILNIHFFHYSHKLTIIYIILRGSRLTK